MKKLPHLSLAHLANEAIVLTQQEQMEVYAGSEPAIDGMCYFEALQILSSEIGEGHDENYYISEFTSDYGISAIWGTYYDSSGNAHTGVTGTNPSQGQAFLTGQFDASSINVGDFQSELNQGHKILTEMCTSNGGMHAIVIEGYNSETGKYIYKDNTGTHDVSTEQLAGNWQFGVEDER